MRVWPASAAFFGQTCFSAKEQVCENGCEQRVQKRAVRWVQVMNTAPMALVSLLRMSSSSALSSFLFAGRSGEHLLAQVDFPCFSRDESTPEMRADSVSEQCCCRVRCNRFCAEATTACQAEPSCVGFHRTQGWATLKAAPKWWEAAPGVNKCKQLDQAFTAKPSGSLRRAWHDRHCGDYTFGDRLIASRTNILVFDIGFHSGDDTLHFLELGHDVVAIDANPFMIQDGMRRPVLIPATCPCT